MIGKRQILGMVVWMGAAGGWLWSGVCGWAEVKQEEQNVVEVGSLAELAERAAGSGQRIRMRPGVYRMSEYLTEEVVAKIAAGIDRSQGGRPPVPMMVFSGSSNYFDLRDVIIEIETELYERLPKGGYVRCLFITGNNNTFNGLTVRNRGANQGSNGNILSVFGNGNVLENVTLYVYGSFPYGYGDLLGKGGPNLVSLRKQSGIMIGGNDNVLRRCKVFSRAFGHCFYIQRGQNTVLEDCYAEGIMRPTSQMLEELSGIAYEKGFRSVYENRDGRFMITAGYMKSLVEDGFRTYGGLKVKLVNCVAINTRAGFEISGPEEGEEKSVIENCLAKGCERAYLLGGNVVVRRSRGDVLYGPVLYLRGGSGADVELEVAGGNSGFTVHALATIAGRGHRVRLTEQPFDRGYPKVPIFVGFGMPAHAEMASPIQPAEAQEVELISELEGVPVIVSKEAVNCRIEARGRVEEDDATRRLR